MLTKQDPKHNLFWLLLRISPLFSHHFWLERIVADFPASKNTKTYFLRIVVIISSETKAIKPSSPIIDKIEEKLDTTDPKKAVSGPKIIPTNNETATNKAKTSVTL